MKFAVTPLMKIQNTKQIVNKYLENYFNKCLDETVEILERKGNKITLRTNTNKELKAIVGIKILKSYSLEELFCMQFEFFEKLKENIIYEIDSEETHIYYKNHDMVDLKFHDMSLDFEDIDTTKGFYCAKEIFNYIKSLINMSVGSSFTLEDFPQTSYRYMIHVNERDYLTEFSHFLLK